jgi:hypothetical protein
MSIYDLIDQKVIDYAEIVVCLFEHCNLVCVFCPQDHDAIVGASHDEILAKTDSIAEWINANKRSTYFKIHTMGGELFQDRWIQLGFLDTYKEFIDQIRNKVSINKHVEPNFITNLLFDDVQSVDKFLRDNKFQISVSYDPKGRFNQHQFEKFKQNVDLLSDHIQMISCVATRQSMQAIIDGDEYFDYLYSKFPCDFDSFLPSVSSSEILMPKESELLAFNKHLIDNYPACLNVSYFTEPDTHNRMSCTRGNSVTILPDGTQPKGCSGSLFLKNPSSNDLGSGAIVEKFLTRYNCFECEFYKKCPFTCFIKNDYAKIVRDVNECVFKESFRYVESKKG